MQIVDFGFFKIRPVEPGEPVILYFENEDGYDWYDLRFALTNWRQRDGEFIDAIYGAWAMVDEHGFVTNVEYDPSRLMPGDRRVLGIDAHYSEIEVGMVYDGGALHPPPGKEDAA